MSLLQKIFKWAECKHKQLTVTDILPESKTYLCKCCQCGDTVSRDIITETEPGSIVPHFVKDLNSHEGDDDVQY